MHYGRMYDVHPWKDCVVATYMCLHSQRLLQFLRTSVPFTSSPHLSLQQHRVGSVTTGLTGPSTSGSCTPPISVTLGPDACSLANNATSLTITRHRDQAVVNRAPPAELKIVNKASPLSRSSVVSVRVMAFEYRQPGEPL